MNHVGIPRLELQDGELYKRVDKNVIFYSFDERNNLYYPTAVITSCSCSLISTNNLFIPRNEFTYFA